MNARLTQLAIDRVIDLLTPAAALGVECMTCGAPVGVTCVSKTNGMESLTFTHSMRRSLAATELRELITSREMRRYLATLINGE